MSHPADRHHRRTAANQHRPYDGDRHLIRTMQAALDAQRAADQQARDQEWDQSLFTVTSTILAFQAGTYLARF